MKMYVVESVKYPSEIIIAANEVRALKEYADLHGYKSSQELKRDCEMMCGTMIDTRDCIEVQCISRRVA